MTMGEFLSLVGTWLLDEPMHSALVLILAVLNLLLYAYISWKQWSMNARLLSVELRHGRILEDIRSYRSDMGTMQSELRGEITATRSEIRSHEND